MNPPNFHKLAEKLGTSYLGAKQLWEAGQRHERKKNQAERHYKARMAAMKKRKRHVH